MAKDYIFLYINTGKSLKSLLCITSSSYKTSSVLAQIVIEYGAERIMLNPGETGCRNANLNNMAHTGIQ
jgi:hypothetical protein